MSKKRDKKILKMLKARRSPKRIAGVKVPKALRRASESQLGAAIIAHVAVSAAGAALMSPTATKIRRQAQEFAGKIAEAVGDTAGGVTSAVSDTLSGRRRKSAAEDLAQADRGH